MSYEPSILKWLFPGLLFTGFFAYARKKPKTMDNNLLLEIGNVVSFQKIRECDSAGCGFFGASRGTRKHQGIDVLVSKGENVYAPISGKIRLSYPYANQQLKGVEISQGNIKRQIFYFNPNVVTGDYVVKGQLIGTAQSVSDYYDNPAMQDHLHIQMKRNNQVIDPTPYFT